MYVSSWYYALLKNLSWNQSLSIHYIDAIQYNIEYEQIVQALLLHSVQIAVISLQKLREINVGTVLT